MWAARKVFFTRPTRELYGKQFPLIYHSAQLLTIFAYKTKTFLKAPSFSLQDLQEELSKKTFTSVNYSRLKMYLTTSSRFSLFYRSLHVMTRKTYGVCLCFTPWITEEYKLIWRIHEKPTFLWQAFWIVRIEHLSKSYKAILNICNNQCISQHGTVTFHYFSKWNHWAEFSVIRLPFDLERT